MQLVSNIYQGIQDYCSEIPKDTPIAMSEAFIISLVVDVAFGSHPSTAAAAGAVSACATLIYGIVTPLFKWMQYVPSPQLNWSDEFLRSGISVIAGVCIAAACGDTTIMKQIPGLVIFNGFWTFFASSRLNLDETHIIFI